MAYLSVACPPSPRPAVPGSTAGRSLQTILLAHGCCRSQQPVHALPLHCSAPTPPCRPAETPWILGGQGDRQSVACFSKPRGNKHAQVSSTCHQGQCCVKPVPCTSATPRLSSGVREVQLCQSSSAREDGCKLASRATKLICYLKLPQLA